MKFKTYKNPTTLTPNQTKWLDRYLDKSGDILFPFTFIALSNLTDNCSPCHPDNVLAFSTGLQLEK